MRRSRRRAAPVTSGRDPRAMPRLTTLLRSFGNDGARANALAVLQTRQREDWVVEGLVRRLEPATPALPAAASDEVARPA